MSAVRYTAFLRGINVGGRRVKSQELCSVFDGLGLRGACTFRASGNVVFEAADEPPEDLSARIEGALGEALGYRVDAFLRSAEQIRAIAAKRPFSRAQLDRSLGKLQVAMLGAEADPETRARMLALGDDRDQLAFGGRELYWLPSGPMLDSPLDMKLIESTLGRATFRTKGTVEQLAAKHFAAPASATTTIAKAR
jgi:uncharacterized protein (DUF1697 family)